MPQRTSLRHTEFNSADGPAQIRTFGFLRSVDMTGALFLTVATLSRQSSRRAADLMTEVQIFSGRFVMHVDRTAAPSPSSKPVARS